MHFAFPHAPALFTGLAAAMALPAAAGARDLTCKVGFACSDGSCTATERHFAATQTETGFSLETQGARHVLVALDRSSGGDLVYGGQLGAKLYGVLFLSPDGGGDLLIEGVNGWSESLREMMICTEAKG